MAELVVEISVKVKLDGEIIGMGSIPVSVEVPCGHVQFIAHAQAAGAAFDFLYSEAIIQHERSIVERGVLA